MVASNVCNALCHPGIVIALGPGAKISGRIVFDGSSAPPQPPTGSGPGTMMFVSREGPGCRSGRGQVATDWTFVVEGVFGTCTAQFNGGIARWFVKSITHEGKDLMDQPTTFAAGQQMRDVEVVMTDKRTELTFHVTDEQGTSTREYVGLMFPVDKARWTDTNSRYIRTVVPQPDWAVGSSPSGAPGTLASGMTFVGVGGGASGGISSGVSVPPGALLQTVNATSTARRETTSGMPAGEYYVIAVDDLETETYRDPEFLEQLSRGATRITIADGASADVNLRRLKLAPQR